MRELENVIQRATVMAKGDVILPANLPPEIFAASSASADKARPAPLAALSTPATETQVHDLGSIGRMLFRWARQNTKLKVLPAVERELIIQALMETNGNQVQAAKLLGITRATLRKRVDKFQIKQQLAIE